MVAAAHNPVLTGLFTEFAPRLHQSLLDLVALLGLRTADPTPGDDGHTALVDAVIDGDADAAARALGAELSHTLALLRSRTTPV